MTVKLIQGDCLEVLKTLDAGSVDAVITDPPYGTKTYATDNAVDWDTLLTMLPTCTLARFGWPEDLVEWCVQYRKVPNEWITWYPLNKPNGRGGLLCKVAECVAIFGPLNQAAHIRRERTQNGKRIAAQAVGRGALPRNRNWQST